MAEEPMAPIPRPIPLDEQPPPEAPPDVRPHPPSVMRVSTLLGDRGEELAVLFKRTYRFQHGRLCTLADEQDPIHEEPAPHEELGAQKPPSWKMLPEVIGNRPGTDVIVQGSALPPRPVPEMEVGVEVGRRYAHRALALGRRWCDLAGKRVVFTPPEPFEEVSLRYENAYGGRDPRFDEDVMASLRRDHPADSLRRVKAVAEELFGDGHPLMYPRNRFGKGYVIDGRPEWVEGRELPQLEWPTDRLTPDRLVVGNPLDWSEQPLPVGFDFLDPSAFPRSSMFGLPPAVTQTTESFPEVERGLIPADFSRGNIFTAKPEELARLIHPWAGRSASLGLWLPFLQGNEPVALLGMDAAHPRLTFDLPGERPSFEVPGLVPPGTLVDAQLHAVHVDVPGRVVRLLWVGRTRLSRAVSAKDLLDAEANLVVYMDKG